jgi:hypothetical protein
MRIGYFVLGQDPNQKSISNFEIPEETLVDPHVNPQELTPEEPSKIPTTQSAIIWTRVEDSLPKYYEPVHIRVGNKVMDKLWSRLSDGDNDFYAPCVPLDEDNRIIRDITHWGVSVTPANVDGVVRLNLLVKLIEENYIPLEQTLGFNREKSEGFNQGVGRAVEVLEREIRRLRQSQSAIKNIS